MMGEEEDAILCLGDVSRIGKTLRSTGGCMRGQGPRLGLPSIFPTVALRYPLVSSHEDSPAECTWYVSNLREQSAICFGVSALGTHAIPLAEDWGTAAKTGRVWYVILRGSKPGHSGGGSFMDGRRVVSSSSALFARKSTWVTLQWHAHVMSVFINEKLVGTMRTDTGVESEEGQAAPELRFATQFWQEKDMIELKGHNLQDSRWIACPCLPCFRRDPHS